MIPPSARALRAHFLLNPDVIFLNHGSFGATPQPVFAAYQAWQRQLEWQPVQFLVERLPPLLAEARQALGAAIHAAADDLVYVPNATFALNVVARSLPLGPGDEVLTSDLEYGACDNVWRFLSQKRGFEIVRQTVPYPFPTAERIADAVWQGVTPRTKVLFISHITSTTALTLPVAALCRRARAAGILTIVDGAHAPGQIPLDLQHIDADIYFGNLHKWMCAPKGTAFLYTRRDRQVLIEPLVVGWGWGEGRTLRFGSDYLDYQQWLGTNDLSAYLAAPAALAFQAAHAWTAVRARCHALLQDALQRIAALTGLPSPYPDDTAYRQMAIAPLPPIADVPGFKARLLTDFRIEIPVTQWHDRLFLRLSIQGYNTPEEVDALLQALRVMLPRDGAGRQKRDSAAGA